jgi:ABC-type nitrate/sulfonate/bicarbonate transport system permease component
MEERIVTRLSRSMQRLAFDPLGILGLLIVLAAWWLVSALQLVQPLFLPPLGAVVTTIRENFFSSAYMSNFHLGHSGIFGSLVYTVTNVAIAMAIACVLGVTLGLTSGRSDRVRALLDPIMLTAGTIPILVTAPFFLIWFGIERSAQVSLLVIYDITIVYLFAQRAVTNLDPTYVAAARTLGANARRVVSDVYLRGTLPEVFGGIRIALAGSWGLEAFSELLGAPQGIGRVIQAMGGAMDTLTMVSAIIALAIVAVGVDFLIAAAFALMTPWRRPSRL